MGIWIPEPALERDESVLHSVGANRTQGRRAVGGRLLLTESNLRFVANRLDRAVGGRDLTIPRGEVTSASVADRSMEDGPFTGGVRRRLKVETRGNAELFVVNHVEEVAARVNEWAGDISG